MVLGGGFEGWPGWWPDKTLAAAGGPQALASLGLPPSSWGWGPGKVATILDDGQPSWRLLVEEDGEDCLSDSDSSISLTTKPLVVILGAAVGCALWCVGRWRCKGCRGGLGRCSG